MLVRDPVNRGWQWTPPPPPNSRWEPAQPPATGDRPILIATWYEPAGGGFTSSRKCTGRIRKEVDTNGPRNPDGSLFEYITIAFSANDVESWSEARPKERHGELGMNREQATYLRDALTAMLERGK